MPVKSVIGLKARGSGAAVGLSMRLTRAALAALAMPILLAAAPDRGRAAEDKGPTFEIVFRGGAIEPKRLEVPAKTEFQLQIRNEEDAAAEFESVQLHKEKVVPPHGKSVVVIRSLEPGEYDVFDDFHPGSTAVIVAKPASP